MLRAVLSLFKFLTVLFQTFLILLTKKDILNSILKSYLSFKNQHKLNPVTIPNADVPTNIHCQFSFLIIPESSIVIMINIEKASIRPIYPQATPLLRYFTKSAITGTVRLTEDITKANVWAGICYIIQTGIFIINGTNAEATLVTKSLIVKIFFRPTISNMKPNRKQLPRRESSVIANILSS